MMMGFNRCSCNVQTLAAVVVVRVLIALSSLIPVLANLSPRHPNQRELRYVVQEELLVGSDIADVADDAGLVGRYGPDVARSALRFRFLATPRVPVEVDEMTGKVRTTGRLDREAICGDGGDHMELCLDRLDIAVQPMNYFQIIKVHVAYQHIYSPYGRYGRRTVADLGFLEGVTLGTLISPFPSPLFSFLLPSLPVPPLLSHPITSPPSSPIPSPPLHLEVGPLSPARAPGGAL